MIRKALAFVFSRQHLGDLAIVGLAAYLLWHLWQDHQLFHALVAWANQHIADVAKGTVAK